MLNRRYLRIKVFQALYAHRQDDPASTARIEKELVAGVERTYDLYLSLLLIFGELRHQAELRIEERRRKKLPTREDLDPNRRFVDNPVLQAIATSERLQAECQHRRISWTGHHELFSKLMREMEASELFKAYMSSADSSYQTDRQFMVELFSSHIANHEGLQDVFEGRSIYWLEDLDLAATMVKRALEQSRPGQSADQWLEDLSRDTAEERKFITALYRDTILHGPEHAEAIAAKASNWESDRIAVTDMLLMQMALAEVRGFPEIPVKVTLNEYIEIAKAYSTPKSKSFLNGILDKLFAEMREDGRIRKVGRGLLEN